MENKTNENVASKTKIVLTKNDIDTGDVCLETYPCKHYVTVKKLGIECECMGALQICKLFFDYGLSDQISKHFARYSKDKRFAPYLP